MPVTGYQYGGDSADFLYTAVSAGTHSFVALVPNANVAFWTAASGGTQITTLTYNGNPVTTVPATATGQLPVFTETTGITSMWADAGAGVRVLIKPTNSGSSLDADTANNVNNHSSLTATALSATFVAATDTCAIPASATVISSTSGTANRLVDCFGGKMWGFNSTTGYFQTSTDNGATWVTDRPMPAADTCVRLIACSDGEYVAAMASAGVFKSAGWAGGSPTWTLKVSNNGTTTFQQFGVDGDGTHFIAAGYSAQFRGDSRYVYISSDSGNTWTQVFDSFAQFGQLDASLSHMHGMCYDAPSGRFYFGVGHGSQTCTQQTITVTGSPTGGTFTLTLGSNTTGPINYNAAASDIATAVTGLLSGNAAHVYVAGGPGPGTPWVVYFVGNLNITTATMTANSSGLTGGSSPNVTVTAATYTSAQIAGTYYTANGGTTWQVAAGMVSNPAPTTIRSTSVGLCCASDGAQAGLFGVVRQSNPTTEVITRTWAWNPGAGGVLGFGRGGWLDPATGIVYFGFQSGKASIPPVIVAGTPTSGGLLYTSPTGTIGDFYAVAVKPAPNVLYAWGQIGSVDKTLTAFLAGRGAPRVDTGNIFGGNVPDGSSVAAGASAVVNGTAFNSTVIGAGANVTGTQDMTAIGYQATVTAGLSVVVGSRATVDATGVTVGVTASTNGNAQCVAIGYNAQAGGATSVVIGNGASSTVASVVVVGQGASATTAGAIAVGKLASASLGNAVAIGNAAAVTGNSTGIGFNAAASVSSTVIGSSASANNAGIAIGTGVAVTGANAIGLGASASFGSSVALGAATTAVNQIAVGARQIEGASLAGIPGAPTASGFRVFSVNDANGKAVLYAKFSSGANMVLAAEAGTTGAVAVGTATLSAGSVTVSNANVTANSIIRVWNKTIGGTPGAYSISAKTAGTSFTIASSSGSDTSVVQWEVESW